jgi:hypothetical protein
MWVGTLIARSKVPTVTVERLMSNVEETGEMMRTQALHLLDLRILQGFLRFPAQRSHSQI